MTRSLLFCLIGLAAGFSHAASNEALITYGGAHQEDTGLDGLLEAERVSLASNR